MIGIIRNINSVKPIATSHRIGSKKVLLANGETETRLTQIAITTLKRGEQSETHVHPTMEECFLVIKGMLTIQVESQQIKLVKDDFIQVKPKQIHSITALTDTIVLTIGCATN